MHFSEIFIVSGTESVLIYKSFRLDTDIKTKDVFLQTLKEPNILPHFKLKETYFFNIKRGGLYFVATSGHEISPIMVIEILCRLYSILKDYCGTVTEDSVQANNLLILEILNEFADSGYVQIASTEKLQPYIQSRPVMVKQTREVTSDITSRVDSVKNDLYIDIIEKLTAVINANGTASTLEVSGEMIVKNFVNGTPQIKIGLNEDLDILEGKSKGYGDHVQLDKCNFHPCVKLEEFESSKVIVMVPPVGEFSAMLYSTCGEIALHVPFRVLAFIDDAENSRDKILTLRLKNELPSNYNAVKVIIRLKVPTCVNRMSQQLNEPDQTAELTENQEIVWTIKKFPGRAEYVANFRLINSTSSEIKKYDIGPIRMDFEISGYTSSGLQIKGLKVQEMGKKINLNKWIRLITVSDSYVIKLWP
ncbi:AP-4 complex subunit mu-1 [Mytilus galloprovincialis]|uniref:AP-4 complex subunit mu-1 n=1 Tax=Mytilus galloprovincialis TaxID=29158 RepID=A0A8B6CLD0_MYTGA|nr:AP-4 complex subunit mu-1 [Mytilus galloprovincialis]